MLEKLKSFFPAAVLVVVLLGLSLFTTHLIVTRGPIIGPVVILSLIGILLLGFMLKDYRLGIYYMFVLAVFMSFINRMMGGAVVQFGVVLDAMAGFTFVVMLLTAKGHANWSVLRSPITYLYIVLVVYHLLQLFNPNAVSFLGWIVAFRGNTNFLLFFVFVYMFRSLDEVKKFTMLWLVMAALVGLYGVWQEVVGLNARELRWIYSNPGRTDLLVIWGLTRKFSLLSDPSSFGLFMAFSALACFIFALGPFRGLYKFLLASLGTVMLISMSFSGTRTAFAMIVVGVAFYIILTIRSRKTFYVMVAVGIGVAALLFGPFYGGTVKRIRSTLNPSRDASMGVRDKKRVRLQTYVQTHPFGGGLNTTGMNGVKYSQGHPLAEGWDPDSGYLLTALETGWIGLILGMAFFFSVVVRGIGNHFRIRDPIVRTYNLAYVVPFMALSVAHFTQDAMFQKPVYLVIIATYALMLTITTYDKSPVNNPLPI
jgi:hypothetical protein